MVYLVKENQSIHSVCSLKRPLVTSAISTADNIYDLLKRSLSLKSCLRRKQNTSDFKERLCLLFLNSLLNLSSESNKTYVIALDYVYLSTYSLLPAADVLSFNPSNNFNQIWQSSKAICLCIGLSLPVATTGTPGSLAIPGHLLYSCPSINSSRVFLSPHSRTPATSVRQLVSGILTEIRWQVARIAIKCYATNGMKPFNSTMMYSWLSRTFVSSLDTTLGAFILYQVLLS